MENSNNRIPHFPTVILKQMKCSRMRGKKGERHPDPDDPPRKRANKQRGHGTYDNDRPPIVGTVGRESGQVRLRVVHNTDRKTLEAHVHRFTLTETTCYTDEWQSYNHILREHPTCRVQKPQQKHSGAKHFSSTWMIQVVHSQLIGISWKNLMGKTPLKQQNRSFKACRHILTDRNRRGRRNVKFLLCI